MTTSLQTIEHLKQLTLGLSNSPLGDYQKVATMFEAVGNVVAILTEQNKAQQKFLKDNAILVQQNGVNEVLYKTIFEHSPDAIFVMRANIYVECNQKALEMFECERNDILNADPMKFSPTIQPGGTPSKKEMRNRTAAATKGAPQKFKWVFLNKNRVPFTVWVRLNKIDTDIDSWFIIRLHKMVKRK